MIYNIGTIDRTARVLLGVTVMAAGVYFGSWWGLIGLVPLLTGIARWCAVYQLLGWSTCEAHAGQRS